MSGRCSPTASDGPDEQGGAWEGPTQDHSVPPNTTQEPSSPSPSRRRSPSYIVCNTTSSDEVLEMKVMVQVDRARIHQDLFFQYVEDPTIVRIEPEWSIIR